MYIKSTMSIRFPSFSPLWCNHLQLEQPIATHFDNITTSQVQVRPGGGKITKKVQVQRGVAILHLRRSDH